MRNNKKFIWGGLLIFLAIYLVAQSFYGFQGPNVFRLGLSVFLAMLAIVNLFELDFIGTFLPIGFIGFINFEYLGFTSGSPFTLLIASILMGFGFSLIFKKKKKGGNFTFNFNGDGPSSTFEEHVVDIEVDTDEDEPGKFQSGNPQDFIKAETNFSDQKRYIRSENFTKADLDCNFGNLEVHFQGATFNPKGAYIHCEANFANITLYLPRTVNVENRLSATLGSATSENVFISTEFPTVVIEGEANLGKIQIRYL